MTAASIASSTETGILVAHHRAMAQPLPKEVRTITGRGTQSPITIIPTGEASSCVLIEEQLLTVYSQCPPPSLRLFFISDEIKYPLMIVVFFSVQVSNEYLLQTLDTL
ncbi:hypothetical protein AVEN_8710-1 [Araneus ventricosus]|uniref:Uncharacterized protein n=1 Tax=Araneus ventricosus TaxID=182803 RepID=A0A4Y2GH30_ARAVE|nr:hypothetical protein AVEN_8710-1 [Araneus ventricosus]